MRYDLVAAEVRAEMARQRISLADLAEATKIPKSTLNRRLSGEYAFTLEELDQVASALGVNGLDLIKRAPTETREAV